MRSVRRQTQKVQARLPLALPATSRRNALQSRRRRLAAHALVKKKCAAWGASLVRAWRVPLRPPLPCGAARRHLGADGGVVGRLADGRRCAPARCCSDLGGPARLPPPVVGVAGGERGPAPACLGSTQAGPAPAPTTPRDRPGTSAAGAPPPRPPPPRSMWGCGEGAAEQPLRCHRRRLCRRRLCRRRLCRRRPWKRGVCAAPGVFSGCSGGPAVGRSVGRAGIGRSVGRSGGREAGRLVGQLLGLSVGLIV